MTFDYQIAVIGGGSGGLTVAAGAASFGAKVALIERKTELGGDCLHYGCMPSKALIQAAKEVKESAKYAEWTEDEYKKLFKSAMERVADALQDVQEHDSKDRFINLGIDIYEAEGTFLDEHTLQVGEKTITAKRFVIATGSSPAIPPIDGLEEGDYLTNETIFSLNQKPSSMVVIGGGVIGVELAQAMSRLGVDVTMIEGSEQILSKEDKEIASLSQRLLSEELNILTNAKAERVEKNGDQVHIHYKKDGAPNSITADTILVAAGRKANIGSLGLDKAGIVTEKGSIQVDATLRTNK
ncbi:dihydrolipoyl dehydrogenase family protein, partial [Halobacillus trueperi]|uniref:dihydrolipoyl dehydrogenase family protein n=1 Tax=Halobacillus trueperi TaxID=156205 RepID=UPI0021620D9F